jgi:hypothetical protein
MDAREERLARNESLFREVNERVRAVAAQHGGEPHAYQFFCECANIDCTFQVEATIAEYEAVREYANRFLVAPEHWLPEVETIVEKADKWWAIEKHGDAAELAEDLDPRTNGDNGD